MFPTVIEDVFLSTTPVAHALASFSTSASTISSETITRSGAFFMEPSLTPCSILALHSFSNLSSNRCLITLRLAACFPYFVRNSIAFSSLSNIDTKCALLSSSIKRQNSSSIVFHSSGRIGFPSPKIL